ncbi:hypothetical protein [Nocardia aurantia]|uniref:Uncharacterized protein n=1 Tax=Nocardia aurantia TaxID=2585199 RepID=A0A7K0DZ56_9NOCA|nr:hypothetical protein [Nocardia aurantia]MQY31100.1 hypothetical protein [Nocardia aurantia]
MRTIAVLAVVAGTLTLAGCGGKDTATDANGLRQKVSTSSVATSAPKSPAPVASPPPASETPTATATSAAASTAPVATGTLGPASRTPCSQFKTLDVDAERTLMNQVLAENPGSKFEGSPNVALGTAKLVCLSASRADTPVAVAIGIAAG